MNVFSQVVFDGPLTGTTAVYTSPQLNALIASAEKYMLQARVAQVAGTTPALKVTMERSNDGNDFENGNNPQSKLISVPLNPNTTETFYGQDLGTSTVGGSFARLTITLGGTNPSAHLKLILTGRDS